MKTENDTHTPSPLGNCAKGEFIRLKIGASQTYRRGTYCRTRKKFSLVNCDDTNREIFRSRNTIVYTGFTY